MFIVKVAGVVAEKSLNCRPLVAVTLKLPFTVVSAPARLMVAFWPVEAQVKLANDWPRPAGTVPVIPVTEQVEPLFQVAVGIVPPF